MESSYIVAVENIWQMKVIKALYNPYIKIYDMFIHIYNVLLKHFYMDILLHKTSIFSFWETETLDSFSQTLSASLLLNEVFTQTL